MRLHTAVGEVCYLELGFGVLGSESHSCGRSEHKGQCFMVAKNPVADGVVSWALMLSTRLMCFRAGSGPSISHYAGSSLLHNQRVNGR